MKKIITLITLGLSLLVEPLTSQYKALNAEPILAKAAESNAKKTREYDLKDFDYASYNREQTSVSFADLPSWSPDLLGKTFSEYESGSVSQLNKYINGNYSLNIEASLDLFSSLSTDIDVNFKANKDLCFIQTEDGFYRAASLNYCSPMLYINQNIKGQKNINFYLGCNLNYDFFESIFNLLGGVLLDGAELPILKIGDYTFLKIEFNSKGYKLIADNYCVISPYKRDPIYSYEASSTLVYKVTIPFIENFNDFYYFSCYYTLIADDIDSYTPSEDIFFAFDESMCDDYYFYAFDLLKVSVIDKCLVVDNSTYFDSEFMADLVSIKLIFKGTKKEKIVDINSRLDFQTIPQYKTFEFNFDRNIGYADGKVRYWFFDDFDLESNVAGELKISSINFHPYTKNTENKYEIDESITLTHHYENANIHKYSFNYERSVRVFYYKMNGYYRNIYKNWGIGTILGGWAVNALYNYQIFGFDFYFDKQKTMAIPNVQAITFKFQMGYSGPNPEEGSNGFYPNDPDDSHKDIIIASFNVEPSKNNSDFNRVIIGNNKLGNDLWQEINDMGVRSDCLDYIMTDDTGYKHDYIFYNYRQRGTDYYSISTMDALEIVYESEAQETVRMVGNSLGLHVVTDEDGDTYVCDSEGNVQDDYGIYESDDGIMIPGKDEDGDGKISIEETINSDTGEKSYPQYTGNTNKPWSIGDLFDNENNIKETIEKIIRIALITLSIIIVLYFLKLVLRIFKRK